jgi:hypothetical protein
MTEPTEAEKAAAEKAEKAAAAAAAEKAEKAAAEKGPAKRYAAFNEDLAKYVGGVRDSRKEADEIAKTNRASGYKMTVREV